MSVVVITVFAIAGLAQAFQLLNQQADRNSSISELDRRYGKWKYFPRIIRDRTVVETAVKQIPENATYSVLIGSRWKPAVRTRWTSSLERDFLRFYLLPRLLTDSAQTRWVICLACNLGALGRDVKVLARGSDGMLLLRIDR